MPLPIKLPPIPRIPQIPSIPRVPKLPIPPLPPLPPQLSALVAKALKGSKLQLPMIKIPNLPFVGALINLKNRIQTVVEAKSKDIEKAKLALNTVARLKEQAESLKSVYTFDNAKTIGAERLGKKLDEVKNDATARITKIISRT